MKDNKNVKNIKKSPEKKETIKFLYKVKNEAKKNDIPYNLRNNA